MSLPSELLVGFTVEAVLEPNVSRVLLTRFSETLFIVDCTPWNSAWHKQALSTALESACVRPCVSLQYPNNTAISIQSGLAVQHVVDWIYRTLQLRSLEWTPVDGNMPWAMYLATGVVNSVTAAGRRAELPTVVRIVEESLTHLAYVKDKELAAARIQTQDKEQMLQRKVEENAKKLLLLPEATI